MPLYKWDLEGLIDKKHIPHDFPSKQLFFIYLFKYCPWLFEMYFTMKGVKI